MSHRKSAAARVNGAKSRGPVTAPGQSRSARNSLRHGLRSQQIVIPGEDPQDFDLHRDAYIQRFQPASQPELDLVESMAAARWRLNRLLSIESRLLEHQFQPGAAPQPPSPGRPVNRERALSLLLRYEARINRTYEQAFKQLQTLQSTRPPDPATEAALELPNEPKLIPFPAPMQPSDPANAPLAALADPPPAQASASNPAVSEFPLRAQAI